MYTITREELLKQIEEAPTPVVRRILEAHLVQMDGGEASCSSCTIEAPEEVELVIEEEIEEDEEE